MTDCSPPPRAERFLVRGPRDDIPDQVSRRSIEGLDDASRIRQYITPS